MQATLNVAVDGTYTFHLGSDEGALVFVDGNLLIDRGGPHGPTFTDGTLFLAAGAHPVEVQFFECCGGPTGLDFVIPLGTGIVTPGTPTIPEPGTLSLIALVLAGMGFARRRAA